MSRAHRVVIAVAHAMWEAVKHQALQSDELQVLFIVCIMLNAN